MSPRRARLSGVAQVPIIGLASDRPSLLCARTGCVESDPNLWKRTKDEHDPKNS